MKARFKDFSMTAFLLAALMILAGCGGGGGGGSAVIPVPASGTITTGLSDPPSCKASLEHVWVTIADVKAHLNPDATTGDSGFVDLTPNLSSSPKQIDLLSAPNTECLLATLGSTSGLPPGKYQQIRVILVANDATGVALSTNGGTNECAAVGGFNCVEDSTGTAHLLGLPSEATTGIKIPPGQLGGGGIMIAAGQGLDLDIDFNACTSVVQAGHSGKFLLKPTLRAAELGTSPLIAGSVVVGSASGTSVSVSGPSPQPVPDAVVWLEQQSTTVPIQGVSASDEVENFIGSAITDSSGNFEFCPVAAGTYDLVVDAAVMPAGGESNATVSTGVTVSSSGGPNNLTIPLVAEESGPAAVDGAFTTANSSATTVDDITFTSLQPFTVGGGSPVQALVPFFTVNGDASTTPAVTTTTDAADSGCVAPPPECSGNTHCVCVTYTAPNSNLVVGAANSTGAGYTIGTVAPVMGSIDAIASKQGSSNSVPECSQSQLDTQPFALLPAPTISAAGTLSFTGCD
jgi:hypothetical protein